MVRTEIWSVLRTLKEEGLAMIVIDKNLAALMKLADRHYIVEKGVTVWNGDSAALQANETLISRYLGV